jgi:protein-S-isoprenylcysteine O-methyltransferase Ste14
MISLEHRIPPPVIGALVAGAMWWLSSLGPDVQVPQVARQALTGMLALSGLTFDLLGLIAFLRRRTTINPLSPSKTTALVTDGVYRITRNPMYVGMALLLTAWAVWLASPWTFAGPVVFILYITRFQIMPEERALATLFGDAFVEYMARVHRWL